MAFAPNSYGIIGYFTHKETGVIFEYDKKPDWKVDGMLFGIYMSDGTKRTAIIKKTVAYVAIDEDEYGNPVLEKLALKRHVLY
jgi:hypothetical protein